MDKHKEDVMDLVEGTHVLKLIGVGRSLFNGEK
jgi:hypothetical protein